MQRDPIREVALAAVFFGALALVAWANDVFERLGGTTVAVALFAAAFAALTLWLDRDVRSALKARWPDGLRRGALSSAAAKSPARKRAAT